ncbi:DinB family protein [Synechococcus sp. Cruz CV-v-12]|uniref:DinB family protein n=1 Tax=Synechococcus sp. Cruz CV-v-12 TaxID=2823728 RepID=UPI0020CC5278|nr:DinB family protein [Synechococcus sp. Cruz CV-v-12]MCP9874373.1 DinB family protein [Synechococcus sp. Cruz CV-v-12]
MKTQAIIDRLQHTPAAVAALCAGLTPEQACARGPAGQWSILEILGHLCDEETLDFRARIETSLRDPSAPWPGIDPEGWVKRHDYASRDLAERQSTFARERAASVAWLRSLRDPAWSGTYLHPNHGPIAVGTLLVSWAAHDALHIRQIAKRLYELATREGEPHGFTTLYAGEWGA